MEKITQRGFSLIELLVALSVAGILLAVGVPSFAEVIKNSRTSSCYNDLVQSLYLARSEAVKSSNDITVCARSSDAQCGNDWNNGWLVFSDGASAAGESTAEIDGTDEILAIQDEGLCRPDIEGIGSSNNTASSASSRNYVRYSNSGQTDWASGSFLICDDRGAEHSRAINIAVTGDIRRGRKAENGNVPLDVFGREVSCP